MKGKNLKCCGNCYYYNNVYVDFIKRSHWECTHKIRVHEVDYPYSVCRRWKHDGKTFKFRGGGL